MKLLKQYIDQLPKDLEFDTFEFNNDFLNVFYTKAQMRDSKLKDLGI